jgi:hypothetical protein
MAIGDVRLQDPSKQLQGHFPSDTTPPAQGLDQDHEGDDMIKSKRRATIKEEMRMMGIRKKKIKSKITTSKGVPQRTKRSSHEQHPW